MNSTHLWLLFIWILLVANATRLAGMRNKVTVNGAIEYRYTALAAFLMVIPIILVLGFRTSFGDTDAYRIGYLNLTQGISEIPAVLFGDGDDKGFTILEIILKHFIGNRDTLFFLIIAALSGGLTFYTYKKYSCNFAISIFLFLASADCIQWMGNGMRQFIAASAAFACVGLYLKKKYIWSILIVLVLSTIHQSVLLVIPAIFIANTKPWSYTSVFIICAVLLVSLYAAQFTDLLSDLLVETQYDGITNQFLSDDGTNLLRVLVYSIPTLLSLIFRRQLLSQNNRLINFCINMSIISMGFYIISIFTSGIYMGRIPIYFSLYNYILLPYEIETIFTKNSSRFIYLLMTLFYLAYFYYQITVAWGF